MSCPYTEDGAIILTPRSLSTIAFSGALAIGTIGTAIYYAVAFSTTIHSSHDALHGTIKNVTDRTITEYLGIPYAKLAGKSGRFGPSEFLEYREGMNLSHGGRPPCPQPHWSPIPGWDETMPDYSDDCLYLNVWRPGQASIRCKPKAVVVVLHGGRFLYGGGGTYTYYDGQFMAAGWDVVVVTPAYRVGVLGFLNAQIASAPGNVGFTDQVNALRWVNRYVHLFGGNPDAVTLLGEEAGAASVGYHLLHNETSSLFQRAMLISGSPFMPTPVNSGVAGLYNANSLAEILGCDIGAAELQDEALREQMVACLKRRNMRRVVEAASALAFSTERVLFGPSLSEEYRWKRGKTANSVKPLDILVGCTLTEGTSYVSEAMQLFGVAADQTLSAAKLVSTLRKLLVVYGIKDSQRVIDHYGYNNVSFLSNVGPLLIVQIAVAMGDFFVFCPIVYFLEEATRVGSRVFFYQFGYTPPYKWWKIWLGVPQFLDIIFATGLLSVVEKTTALHQADKNVARDMAKMFAGFVKTGNPNVLPNLLWQRWEQSRRAPLKLDHSVNRQYDLDPKPTYDASCGMWRNLM